MAIVGGLPASYAAYLKLNISPALNSNLPDGARIGQGQIICGNGYQGVRIQGNQNSSADIPQGHYNMYGKNNPAHTLRVRLESDNWKPEAAGTHEILKFNGAEMATFDIVADGKQQVPPDEYTLRITGECLSF